VLDLIADIRGDRAFLKFGFQPGADHFEQLFILGEKRAVEILVMKDQGVAGGFEPYLASKVGFQQLPVFGRGG
jgi:hypothetical protein